MRIIKLKVTSLLTLPQKIKQPLILLVGHPRPRNRKVVPNRRRHQERTRRIRQRKVPKIQALLHKPRKHLFRVLRPRPRPKLPPTGHVTRRNHRRQPRLKHRQISRLRPPARVARHRNPPRINLRPRQQIVKRPDPIPHKVPGQRLPRQQCLQPRHIVFSHPGPRPRPPRLRVQILQPLTLSRRIKRQHRKPLPHKPNKCGLVGRRSLPIHRVPRHAQNRRKRPLPHRRQI